ncbi:MAG: hypothetical protein JJ879_13930, partial [Sneathiella sp.]|nr:hypothetical protein [Sneathiella sp.]
EQQVERFLSEHDNFRLLPLNDLLPEKQLSLPAAAVSDGMLTLTPDMIGSDGFFAAALLRV